MKVESELTALSNALYNELTAHIVPYWKNRVYERSSGKFVGRIDYLNQVHPEADRSVVLLARIAYIFGATYKLTGDKSLLEPMEVAVRSLNEEFWDNVHGGLYWMTDFRGNPTDTKKHVYAQSFGIYAYAAIVEATGDLKLLERAINLFTLIEENAFMLGSEAYYEAFKQDWTPHQDVRLGESDLLALHSTNTHLHLLEAYAALYKVWPDQVLKKRIVMLLEIFLSKIYNAEGGYFYAFFNENWQPKSTVYSYGHDIETVWLMVDAASAINCPDLRIRCEQVTLDVAKTILKEGIDNQFGGVFNAGKGGSVVDTDKHWWAQAEAMVGLMLTYKLTGDKEYLNAVLSIWEFISKHVIDHKHGEWFFRVRRDGKPIFTDDKVGPWKCPYHTSRACLLIHSMINEMVFENSAEVEPR